jgi:YD repeat-containing protein
VAIDGSGMTFVADQALADEPVPTTFARTGSGMGSVDGRLYFRDGTLYRFKNSVIEYIRDANGNTISFAKDPAYDRITSITDSMNRTVTLAYDVAANSPNPNSTSTFCPADATVGCDFITYGDPAAPRVITVVKTTHDQAFRVCTAPDPMYTFQNTDALFPGVVSEAFHVTVLRRVILPNSQQYTFSYNAYAELARAQLPTGGAFEYDWGAGVGGELTIRQVLTRRVYSDGGTVGQGGTLERSETYSVPFIGTNSTVATVTTSDASSPSQTLKIENHLYYGSPQYYSGILEVATPWQEGLEYLNYVQDGANHTLRTTATLWTARPPFVNWSLRNGAYSPQPDSPVPCQENVTLDGTATSAKVFLYDQDKVSTALLTHYNNLTDVYEYDYGAAPTVGTSCYTASNIPGGYYRHTQSTYWASNYDTTQNVHLLSLLQESTVSVPSGTVSDTHYYYDEGSLTSRSGASTGREALLAGDYDSPDGSLRGNLTRVSRWLNTTGGWVDTSQTFDTLGNVASIKDANNQTTQLFYDDRFTTSTQIPGGLKSYAFVTTATNPLSQSSNTQYNYYFGKPEWFQDPNGFIRTFTYSDPLDRMTRATSPDNGWVNFAYVYSTGTTTVTTTTALTGSSDPAGCTANTQTVTSAVFDGLGRKIHSQVTEGSGSITTDTVYDSMGRAAQVSNPYRSTLDPTYGTTTTSYDALDRPWKVTYPDLAVERTAYNGAVTTHVDPKPAWRQMTADAFGRITKVIEDPTATVTFADGSSASNSVVPPATSLLNIQTSYGYDLLDNLTSVQHSGDATPSRIFVYDSLKRMTSATNPESGTTGYTYDSNGNVATVTDSRGVVKCFGTLSGSACTSNVGIGYDALNRPLKKNYYIPVDGSRNPVAAATPGVAYVYDTVFVGRLSSVTATNAAGVVQTVNSYTSYDQMGRVKGSSQNTNGVLAGFAYSYNLAGLIEQQTYQPTNRTLTYCYDEVGRTSSVTGKVGSGSSMQYALLPEVDGSVGNAYSYAPQGAIQHMKLGKAGSALDEWWQFNNRLQPTSISVAVGQNSPLWYLTNTYGANNNGNIQRQTISAANATQSYTYDALNRITGVTGETGWSQAYQYDPLGLGNRMVSGSAASPGTPVPGPGAMFWHNQWDPASHGGANAYDAAGNLTSAQGGAVSTYDAENRLATANGGSDQYTYDGEGQRTTKVTPSGTTTYVYDASGELAAEYGSSSWTGTEFLTTDQLGSTRLITTNGAVQTCIDYVPFGERIPATWGTRGGVPCYGNGAPVNQLFTGKERDTETASITSGRGTSRARRGGSPAQIGPHNLLPFRSRFSPTLRR